MSHRRRWARRAPRLSVPYDCTKHRPFVPSLKADKRCIFRQRGIQVIYDEPVSLPHDLEPVIVHFMESQGGRE